MLALPLDRGMNKKIMKKHPIAFIVTTIISAITMAIITIALPCGGYAQTDGVLQFQERSIRAVLKDDATVVVFPFWTRAYSSPEVRARVSLAWLDPDDRTLSEVDTVAAMNYRYSYEGTSAEIEIPFPLVEPSIWTRLRYSVTPEVSDGSAAAPPFRPISGIVSLSQIAGHAFELKTSQIGSIQRSP